MPRRRPQASRSSLAFLKPYLRLLPEVAKPKSKVQLKERLFWTVMCLFVYLVMCQVPVFGIEFATGSDPIHWMRVIMASTHGTLMELGITPLVTTSLVMQFLKGVGVIRVGDSQEDQAVFDGAQKLCGLFLTLGQAILIVMMGMYGPVNEIGISLAMILVLQLFVSGVISILLDELLQKGHGLGSGVSLFIATNVCETVLWKSFSPSTVTTHRGTEYEGAVIALFHMLLTRDDKVRALKEGFYRSGLPNLTNLLATVLVFLIVIYFQGWKSEITIQRKQTRGSETKFPIKLFYTSNMPIILQSNLVTNFVMLSQVLHRRFGSNIIVNILGTWTNAQYTSQTVPMGGLVYYISAPSSLSDMIADPLHALTYILFVLLSCAMFSYYWIGVSGAGADDVMKYFHKNEMIIKNHSESYQASVNYLNRYIPISAKFGGMCIGALTIMADFLGALGSGTGVLLSVTIIHQYYETFMKEEGMEMLSGFF